MKQRKLWIGFLLVMTISFSVLLYFGHEIYQQAPPIPEHVVLDNGDEVFTAQDISDGQNVWQSIGGQEVGTVWGHGAYVAPDWTADYIHREADFFLSKLAQDEYNKDYNQLNKAEKAALDVKLQELIRPNTYNPDTKTLTISALRYQAFLNNKDYYSQLFMSSKNDSINKEREAYAIRENSIDDPAKMDKMAKFFFWSAWSCVTNRPNSDISYTNNWPNNPNVGNTPSGDLVLWTGFSIIMLLLGIGILVFVHTKSKEEEPLTPATDPLAKQTVTPSMRAVLKYIWVVGLLILVQVLMGGITAHFGVEGDAFYGLDINKFLPYSISRTWHIQIGIFWIATAWLATGLYMAPSLSGKDPKFQKLGVNILFGALLIVVAGSLAGQWFGVMQKLGLAQNFWFGHQGYEYVDLGRFWQILLTVGLFLWLALMVRPILPILKKKDHERGLLTMFLISCAAIAIFYTAGLMWGRRTNLAIVEYWRWWVVHLWVEGFFEVFATVVGAFLFTRMGLIRTKTATNGVLFSAIIFLSGGILGTFHHLYFTGTPTGVMALGATFSALEVVPLVLIGIEAYGNYKLSKTTEWLKDYKWPIYFLIAVAFWNFLGAGIFGFLINPPIALYYMQGLNTTPLHGHAAMLGVYGMLGIGLILFVLRSMFRDVKWSDKLLGFIFWATNGGLLLMLILSLLPVGILQTIASVKYGMWYARSAEFLATPTLMLFKWLRAIGDTVFAVGVLALFWFIIKLSLTKCCKKNNNK